MKNIDEIIPIELFELAELFPADSHLFVVGGFVRDFLLFNKASSDIDITASLTPSELESVLKGSKFKLIPASPRLGTMIIKGARSYEYTAFRVDSYPVGDGVHTPTSVEFTKDIEKDARRRDFKCNAVYYDLNDRKIVDPLNGAKDIENKVLNTVINPNIVLAQDGLRILRLARMVSTLGFDVNKDTFDAAKSLVERLKDISVERIQVELVKILDGDNVYKALCLLRDLNAFEVIFPDLAKGRGLSQNAKFHKYDVMEHTFKTVEAAPKKIRLAALFHDVGKPICQQMDGNTYRHDVVGAELTRKILTQYRFSNEIIDFTVELVGAHMFDVADMARVNTIRKFIVKHPDNILDIVDLQVADGIGTGLVCGPLRESRTKEQVLYMKAHNIPFRISDLKINGDDLKEMGYQGKEIGSMLNDMLEHCLFETLKNDKDALLDYARRKRRK